MPTPHHEHDLQLVDPLTVYWPSEGRWKCIICNRENNATLYTLRCRVCSFDLCYSCVHADKNDKSLAHQHQLHYLETGSLPHQNQNGVWRCAVCKKTNNFLRETFSYHCASCADFADFDICRNCFEPRLHPIHLHVLQLVDTSLVYRQSGGSWVCDICGHQSRPYEKFSYHCAECEFDVCLNCFKPQTTPLHNHPLYKANSHDVYAQFNGGWRCDHCMSVHNNPLDHYPWHCPACEYDLCQNCMRAPGLSLNPRLLEENPWLTRDQLLAGSGEDEAMPLALTTERGNAVAHPEDTEDNSKCIICMENPKNATVIHGDTGHCCCCLECAQVLRIRGDPCPICRAPIEHVIRQFNA